MIANIASDEKYIRAEKIEHIKAELHDFQEDYKNKSLSNLSNEQITIVNSCIDNVHNKYSIVESGNTKIKDLSKALDSIKKECTKIREINEVNNKVSLDNNIKQLQADNKNLGINKGPDIKLDGPSK